MSSEVSDSASIVNELLLFLRHKVVTKSTVLDLPTSAQLAFELAASPIDLLLEILPAIHVIRNAVGLAKLTWLIAKLALLIMKVVGCDQSKQPTQLHQDTYMGLLNKAPYLVYISSAFDINFSRMEGYVELIRGMLRQRQSRLAIETMTTHGTPPQIKFLAHILPSLVQMKDIYALDYYIQHSRLDHPEYRRVACDYIQNILLALLGTLTQNAHHFELHSRTIESVKKIQSYLVDLVDDANYPFYAASITTVIHIKSTLWLLDKSQTDSITYTADQIQDANLCLEQLLLNNLAQTADSNKVVFKHLIVTRLCQYAYTFELGQQLAVKFEITEFAIKFKRPFAMTTHRARCALDNYLHESYIHVVECEDTLACMEKIIHQCGNGSERIAVGLSVECTPSIEIKARRPAVVQIAINEVCRPTTSDDRLNAFIGSQGYETCRITFVVDVLALDISRVLNWIFRDDEIIKIGFDFTNVSLFSPLRLYKVLRILRQTYNLLTERHVNFVDMDIRGEGLGRRVEVEMGMQLDEVPRLSNWEERPLLPLQFNYAASEAMVLVDMFYHGVESKW